MVKKMKKVRVRRHYAGPLMKDGRWSRKGNPLFPQGRPWTWTTIKVKEKTLGNMGGD